MAKKRNTSRRPPKTSQSADAAKKKAWTVMVYMAASKDDQTEKAAIADIKEMEAADTANVNVVVLLDREWPELPQLYRIVNGMSVPICPGKLADEAFSHSLVQTRKQARGTSPKSSTGDPQALIDFIDWVLADRAGKDEHFFLVLWGHNFGLGFGRDHNDPLTLPELKGALAKFGEGKLTMLGANTCAMSYAEAAFELQASADYLVASQTAVPLTGWPYTTILSRIAADPRIRAPGARRTDRGRFCHLSRGRRRVDDPPLSEGGETAVGAGQGSRCGLDKCSQEREDEGPGGRCLSGHSAWRCPPVGRLGGPVYESFKRV